MGNTLKKLVIFDRNVVRYPEDRTSIYFDEFIRLGDNAHAETGTKIRRNEAIDGDIALIVYDMGPGGGQQGGRIVARGTPEEIAGNEESITGKYLKNILAN